MTADLELPPGPERDVSGLLTREAAITSVGTAADRTIHVVASTDDEDSHGTVLRNWNLERYQRNPTVLFAHNRFDLPIGTASNVVQQGNRLEADITFLDEADNPVAERCLRCTRKKALRGVSVGFRRGAGTKVSTEYRDGNREVLAIEGAELCEISMLPIGSNPNALAELRALAVAAEPDMSERGAVPYSPTKPVESTTWDAGAAERRLRAWAGDSAAKLARGYAYWDGEKVYKLPHHDVQGGELVVSRKGVIAAGNAMQGSRGGVRLPAVDRGAVRSHLEKHYHQFEMTAPWEKKDASGLEPASSGEQNMNDETENREVATLEAKLSERETKIVTLEGECHALKERIASLEAARTEQQKRADEVTAELVKRDLDGLVGVKITPAELPGLSKLAVLNRALYDEQLAAVKARPDMVLTTREPVIGADKPQRSSVGPRPTTKDDNFSRALKSVG